MSMKYSHFVYIGRFNPPHVMHIEQVKRGLQLAGRGVIVLGSHLKARDPKDPFNTLEREMMIRDSLSSDETARVDFIHMPDFKYNNPMWLRSLEHKVDSIVDEQTESPKICVVGAEKDRTSWYLNHLPSHWTRELGFGSAKLNATDIRREFFEKGITPFVKESVPQGTLQFLEHFVTTDRYKKIASLHKYHQEYDSTKYPRNDLTADVMVVKDGHVLVIKRGYNPGKGLYALPGGFVSPKETIADAAFRELKEETEIKFPIYDMKRKYIVDQHYFDAVDRSLRSRIVTFVFCVKLPDGGKLPIVKGGDDAAKAMWIPLTELGSMQEEFFEDHYHIINYFASKYVGSRFFDEELR